MTKNKLGRSIASLSDDAAAGERGDPLGSIRDPIAKVSEDLTLVQLTAFRSGGPDLKAFAREPSAARATPIGYPLAWGEP